MLYCSKFTQRNPSAAPVADGDLAPLIHQHLADRELLPETHLADTGFVDAELLVQSRGQYGVNLVGPTRANYHWQSLECQPFHCDELQTRLGKATSGVPGK